MVKFFNSLTKKVEEFDPLIAGEVSLYSCGPTVYNFAHIGNLRAFIFSDLLKRYLQYRGFKVKHVMNITDVDDKTIRDSQKAGESLQSFTDRYLKEFISDLDTLFVDKAETMPRATEEIDGMVKMIEVLIEKGHAYKAESGDIYFTVSSFPTYGELVGLDASALKANAGGRLNSADEYDKENVQDFALWKAHQEGDGDVFWETSIGKGRPGWHIECSVMSTKYLGQPFDIHTGGVDLKFPHHTNEIAQSECCIGEKFVRYWMHNEHLLVNGKKMSKSAGTFFTLRDLLEKGHDARAIRYELIKTHYRQHLDFREDSLTANKKIVGRFQGFYERLKSKNVFADGVSDWQGVVDKCVNGFIEAMDEDLNISEGLASIFEFMKAVNKEFENLNQGQTNEALQVFQGFDSVLAVLNMEVASSVDGDLEVKIGALIEERAAAKKEKNYERSDQIRDELLAMGIEIKDTPDGVKWKQIN